MTDTQVTWLTEEAFERLKAELDQLIANRPVDQHRSHRSIDAAGQSAQYFLVADLFTDFCHSHIDERAHVPVAPAATDVEQEIL